MNSLVFGLLLTFTSVLAAPSPHPGPQPGPQPSPSPFQGGSVSGPSALAQPRPSPAGPTPGADPTIFGVGGYGLSAYGFGYPYNGLSGYPGLYPCASSPGVINDFYVRPFGCETGGFLPYVY
ncbi:lipid transfer protein EARLI 1-like [Homalodisca vitripennis]|uniref:lipid transfer protein EARLI 1-like n=1 Tax=Homalodisca vitripennis TaxID=197043 RepID=UPI001EECADFB|nr:lipid transfer protein EARLI 1-like [Homalodisca vitripennis]